MQSSQRKAPYDKISTCKRDERLMSKAKTKLSPNTLMQNMFYLMSTVTSPQNTLPFLYLFLTKNRSFTSSPNCSAKHFMAFPSADILHRSWLPSRGDNLPPRHDWQRQYK